MRLRDRIRAAVRTFRETPDVHSRLTTAEYELKLADQALELRKRECEDLRGTMEEKDSWLQFLKARTTALSSALKELSPSLSTTEEMKHFYDTVSRSLDPEGFTLYRVAEKMMSVDLNCLFPDGELKTANGHQLLKYLTEYCFDEVDTSTPEYQRFERQLYESVLTRMGFDELLAPEGPQQMTVQEQQATPLTPAMTMI